MASSAATPPKLAPYPTLVGTAMTGQLTRPPTTLARAPSHAGDGDDHLCLGKFLGMREQAVQAGDTYVVEAVDLVAIELGCQCGFLGDGQVARAGAGDDDVSVAGGGGLATHQGELGVRDISQVDVVAKKLSGARGFFGIQACD